MKENLNTDYSAGTFTSEIEFELHEWQAENKVERLWKGDPTLWTNSDENKWTGWLALPQEKSEISRIKTLATEISAEKTTDIVLLGMGGSSLCPAMFSEIFKSVDNFPRLHILDSTDPDEILYIQNQINLKNTFFIVSSKSGTTLEPTIFKDYFYNQLQKIMPKEEIGSRFIAITDPGTPLETLAIKENFKAIFHGVPSVGGRYSALSNFGMVPLGLMGIDVETFLNNAKTMYEACLPTTPAKNNPGIVLGAVLGIAEKNGKDKLTLVVSKKIKSLGAWLEQLIAESTGKQDRGLIPIDQEPCGIPRVYGNDRIFAYIRLDNEPDQEQDRAIDALEQAGFMVVRLHVRDQMHLAAELFRWEIAIAVAGSIIGINPFNQPDVEESKILALEITSQYDKTKTYVAPEPFFSTDGISLFADDKSLQSIHVELNEPPSLEKYFHAFINLAEKNYYVDFSAFLAMFDKNILPLQKCRVLVRDATLLATCLGFGPRFLHSTGQDYKGGPNKGLFFQITSEHKNDIPVPDHHYTFGFVINAQAEADFSVLAKRDRRILRIHLHDDVEKGLNDIVRIFSNVL